MIMLFHRQMILKYIWKERNAMDKETRIKLFKNKKIRTAWDEEKQNWYFSIVDIIAILTESTNPQTYQRVLKKRLKDEGNETVINCNALKMINVSKIRYGGYYI